MSSGLYLAGLSRKHFVPAGESVCVCSPACGGAEWLKRRRRRLWEGG